MKIRKLFSANRTKWTLVFGCFLILTISVAYAWHHSAKPNTNVISYTVDPQKQEIAFFLNDAQGNKINHFQRLQELLSAKHKELLFAMNGGMYDPQFNPVGLYIENNQQLKRINRNAKSNGSNFLTQPNGVFYIQTDGSTHVCKTANMVVNANIKYATQSGPMLVFDGKINPVFSPKSQKTTIRNGVGILSNNQVLFAISESAISMYDFAKFFKDRGCTNALYLDGGVSQIFYPEKKLYFGMGRLGVLIGVIKK